MGTKENIMDIAKKLFVKNGFDGTTVREICEAADVSVSAINYHFENKEGLFKAILMSINNEHFSSGFEALEAPESVDGFKLRLRFFIDAYLTTYLEDPEAHILVTREYEKGSRIMDNYFINRAASSFKKLVTYIEESKYNGILNPDVNSGFVAGLIFNQINSQIRHNSLSKETFGYDLNDPAFRKSWINESINIIFNGIKAESNVTQLKPTEQNSKASNEF